MKIKIFNTEKEEWEEYVPPKVKTFGESVTDKSHYRPNVSKLNDVIGDCKTVTEDDYMFKDGVDNGIRMYELSNPALDRAERDELIEQIKMNSEEEQGELKKLYEEEIAKNSEEIEKCTTQETVKTE